MKCLQQRCRSFFKAPRGYTLTELLITLAIMAILSGIAAPNVYEMYNRRKVKHLSASLEKIVSAIRFYEADYGAGWRVAGLETTGVPKYLTELQNRNLIVVGNLAQRGICYQGVQPPNADGLFALRASLQIGSKHSTNCTSFNTLPHPHIASYEFTVRNWGSDKKTEGKFPSIMRKDNMNNF